MNKLIHNRILILSRDIEIGGMQKAALNLSHELLAIGIQVDYFCLFRRLEPTEFKKIDPKVTIIKPTLLREKTPRWFYVLYDFFRLNYWARINSYDAIISIGEHFNGFNLLMLWVYRKKIILMDRMSPDLNLGFPVELLRRKYYKYSHSLIVQTEYAKEILFKKTQHRNINVIRNYIDKSIFRDIELQPKKFHDINILYIGRLSPEKGISVLTSAFKGYSILNRSARLNIVGEGILKYQIDDFFENNNLKNKVTLVDATDSIAKFYNKNNVFVLSSLAEGFPNVLIEAMTFGLVCFVSDFLENRLTFLKDGINVIFFKTGDAEDLINKMQIYLNDPLRCSLISSNAIEISDYFNSDLITQEYLKVISAANCT